MSLFSLWCAAVIAAHPSLSSAEQAFAAQAYAEAIEHLKIAVQAPQLSREERRRVYDLLAKSHLALGQSDAAVEAYASLLAAEPSAPMPEGAPKVRESFRIAKERVYPGDSVSVRPLAAAAGDVVLQLIDPWNRARSASLFERSHSAMPYLKTEMQREGEVLRGRLLPDTIAYYVEVFAADPPRLVANWGSEANPLEMHLPVVPSVQVPAEPIRSRQRWPKWAVGGLALASLLAGVGLAISSSQDSLAAGRAPFADQKKSLDDSAIAKGLAANVTIIGGAAGGVGAVALWVFE